MRNNSIRLKEKETINIESKLDVIVVGDRCRIKKKDVLFEDKMKSKYSHTIDTVIRVKTNSLYVVNNKGEEQKVKKSDVKIILKILIIVRKMI